MTICARHDWTGHKIGSACDGCGHTNLVHPGAHNPSVTGCQLCVITDTIDRLDEQRAEAPSE